MAFVYRIESGTLSILRLRHALQLVVMKHQALRTAFHFDSNKQQLMQRIIKPTENEELFTFVDSEFETSNELLSAIMDDEQGNSLHFDLARGLVCRLHVIRQGSNSNSLRTGDIIIFNFHHAIFDFHSMAVFQRDLSRAYETGHLELNNERELRYLDCKLYHRLIF